MAIMKAQWTPPVSGLHSQEALSFSDTPASHISSPWNGILIHLLRSWPGPAASESPVRVFPAICLRSPCVSPARIHTQEPHACVSCSRTRLRCLCVFPARTCSREPPVSPLPGHVPGSPLCLPCQDSSQEPSVSPLPGPVSGALCVFHARSSPQEPCVSPLSQAPSLGALCVSSQGVLTPWYTKLQALALREQKRVTCSGTLREKGWLLLHPLWPCADPLRSRYFSPQPSGPLQAQEGTQVPVSFLSPLACWPQSSAPLNLPPSVAPRPEASVKLPAGSAPNPCSTLMLCIARN